MKLIKPHDKNEIIKKINENKKKKYNINRNNFGKVLEESVNNKIDSDPLKGKNNIQEIKQINPFN